MKYIIPQNKVDKVVFKYLDLKHFEKKKSKYFDGIVFGYPNEKYGVLGWEDNGTLYIYPKLINEISSTFGLDKSESQSIIGRWVIDRFQLKVIITFSTTIILRFQG